MMETQALLMMLDMIRDLLPLHRAVKLQSDSMMAIHEVRDLMCLPRDRVSLLLAIHDAWVLRPLNPTHSRETECAFVDWAACSNDFVWGLEDPIPKLLLNLMLSNFTFDSP
ncbi:hypothetical protein HPP92_018871 [Vanilla planifolia]|uniref:Uncharacterized protein n=1 Tax=Vanilla planifolia TaxID=51239 RepID=A0A835UK78_VANPL|nr:hypothetical protein HPP92_018871 [Vanilla planifolia]